MADYETWEERDHAQTEVDKLRLDAQSAGWRDVDKATMEECLIRGTDPLINDAVKQAWQTLTANEQASLEQLDWLGREAACCLARYAVACVIGTLQGRQETEVPA